MTVGRRGPWLQEGLRREQSVARTTGYEEAQKVNRTDTVSKVKVKHRYCILEHGEQHKKDGQGQRGMQRSVSIEREHMKTGGNAT